MTPAITGQTKLLVIPKMRIARNQQENLHTTQHFYAPAFSGMLFLFRFGIQYRQINSDVSYRWSIVRFVNFQNEWSVISCECELIFATPPMDKCEMRVSTFSTNAVMQVNRI
jgi:hypothetical protein